MEYVRLEQGTRIIVARYSQILSQFIKFIFSTFTEALDAIMEKNISKNWDISVVRRNILETAFEQIRDAE